VLDFELHAGPSRDSDGASCHVVDTRAGYAAQHEGNDRKSKDRLKPGGAECQKDGAKGR